MGIGELVGRVLTVYKADTSDMEAGLKKLTGEQRKQAQAALDGVKAQNKAVDGLIKSYHDARAAAADVTAVLKASIQEFQERTRLSAAASSIDIGRIRQASGGLRSDMELLKLSVAGAQGAFRLNTQEMEKVAKGMRALEARGFDLNEVFAKTEKALREGAIDQLGEFGIQISKTGDIAKDKQALFDALAKQVREVGGAYDQSGDNIRRAGVQWENTLGGVRSAIGELVVAMGPLLTEFGKTIVAAGQATAGIVALGAAIAQLPDQIAKSVPGGVEALRIAKTAIKTVVHPGAALLEGVDYLGNIRTGGGGIDVDALTAENLALAERLAEQEGLDLGWGFGQRTWANAPAVRAAQQRQAAAEEAAQRRRGAGGKLADIPDYVPNRIDLADEGANPYVWVTNHRSRLKEIADSIAYGQGINTAVDQRESTLEAMFGPVSDFEAYATGFKLLEDAVSSAFEAWITGSKSFGAAVKDALAAGAASLAKEALMQALRHTAYGIGSLAIGGPLAGASAASHFKAAATWGGVAAVAGGVAKLASGGQPSVGAGAPGGYRASGVIDHTGPRAEYRIIGDVASDSSNRRKAREQRRLNNLAERFTRPSGSIHGAGR